MTADRLSGVARLAFDFDGVSIEAAVALRPVDPDDRREQAMTLERRLLAELAPGARAAASRSYADRVAACAIAWSGDNGPSPLVGVDIQADDGVARFPNDEIDAVALSLGFPLVAAGADRRAAFFRRWTALEARGKAIGVGLTLPPARIIDLTARCRVRDLADCGVVTPEGAPRLYGALCVGRP